MNSPSQVQTRPNRADALAREARVGVQAHMMRTTVLILCLFLPACLEECSGLRSAPIDCAQCARSCDELCAPAVGIAQCSSSNCECECEYPDSGVMLDAGQSAPDAAFCQFYADAC